MPGKQTFCVLKSGLAARIANLSEGVVIAKFRIVRSFLQQGNEDFLGRRRSAGA
jgi:hypothetical protein